MGWLLLLLFPTGTQVSTKKAILIESGVQCNIANLPPLHVSLLSTANVEDLDPEERMKPAILEFPEEEPFQDVEVDDEDYSPCLDPEDPIIHIINKIYTAPLSPIQSCWLKFRIWFCIASDFDKGVGGIECT